LLLLLLTVGVLVTGLLVGSFETNFSTLRQVLLAYNPDDPAQFAVVHLRLPRVLLGFLVGGALAFSGYLIQAMVNNPLADPYILGTASGAALGGNLAYFGWLPVAGVGLYLPPLFAFAGALGVTLLVVALAYRKGYIVPTQLLLGGVAVSSLVTAINSLLAFLSDSKASSKRLCSGFWAAWNGRSGRTCPCWAWCCCWPTGCFCFSTSNWACCCWAKAGPTTWA
jgi:iron complex transport system permease protein